MPDPAVPVAAPDVVERLQRQLTIPLSIMGGESYVLDTDDVREATAEITRLREELAAVTLHLRTAEEAADHSPFSSLSLACTITALRARVAELEAALRKGVVPMVVQGEELNGAMLEQLDAMKADLNPLMEQNNRMAEALGQIGRMRCDPDPMLTRWTLAAAAGLARKALGQE